jgi:ribosomal protein S18 acetylase RimI-like enzyme
VIVRKLTPQDAAAYHQVRLRALRDSPTAFSASYEDEAGRTLEEVAPRLTAAADGSMCMFGVFEGEALAGFVAFIRPQRAKIRQSAELAGMYVVPEFRRRGLGRVLMDAVIAHARALDGVRQLRLGVNAANDPAVGLYRSAGFTRCGVEPDALCIDGVYYDEDRYILRLGE